MQENEEINMKKEATEKINSFLNQFPILKYMILAVLVFAIVFAIITP